jgi:hypothetical protein
MRDPGAVLLLLLHHPDKPSGDKERYLQDLFWRISLSGRYSYACEGKLAQDVRRVDLILEDQQPTYDYSVDTSADFIRDNGWLGTGRSFIKALLCLLTYHQPKSLDNDALVHTSNDRINQGNSKNYHHFFPKADMRKKLGRDEWTVNHIANITIVDDFLNKRKIKDKPPATYMEKFAESNPNLVETMESHLIDLDGFGVWENDYGRFSWERCEAFAKELEQRVIPPPVDARGQVANRRFRGRGGTRIAFPMPGFSCSGNRRYSTGRRDVEYLPSLTQAIFSSG